MTKQYKDRAMEVDSIMEVDSAPRTGLYFFPKKNPPVAVEAESVEEAEALLDIKK